MFLYNTELLIKMRQKIKEHFAEKKHHYKVALLGVILFAIFFFARTAGDGNHQVSVPQELSRCWSDRDCSANQFCEFDICLSETGKCIEIPEICPVLIELVCGCDGKTYANDCERKSARVSKEHDGAC